MRIALTVFSSLIGFGLVGSALLPNPTTARNRDWSFTTNIDGDTGNVTCSDIKMSFWDSSPGDVPNVRRDQTVSITQSTSTPLRMDATTRGGIRVQPSSDGSYSATICQVAAAEKRADADAILDRVQASYSGGELRVTGPDDWNWGCYVILNVPRGSVLDLKAENGGLSLRDVDGKFDLLTVNGPIGLDRVSGTVNAHAQNGPIDIKGGSGDIRAVCENGPIGVKLNQPVWEGRGLDASTRNGPISVVIPKNVRTGVRVQGSENSPVSWSGWTGDHWGIDDDGGRKVFRFGSGETKVRVSTVNGPISIKPMGGEGKVKSKSSRI